MSFITRLYILFLDLSFFEMYLDADVFWSILYIGIKILLGFRYRSFLEGEELLCFCFCDKRVYF